MALGGWGVRPGPSGVLTAVTVRSGGRVVTRSSWSIFGGTAECNISATRATGSGTCSQLSVSECDARDGVALDLVLRDCSTKCVCATLDSNGAMTMEEM